MEFEKSKLEWMEFDILQKYSNVFGAVFLRHGGTSEGPFFSLNLSDNVGDHPDSVKVNKSLIIKMLNPNNMVFAKQQHSGKILEITENNACNNLNADGLYTKQKGIALAVTHADCQGAIFWDEKKGIIGVVHAGWKGLVKNIYKNMVDVFINQGSLAKDIVVAISPSIGPKYFVCKEYKDLFPKEFWSFKKDDFHFNLWDIAHMQLRDLGILDENIEITKTCTYSNPKDYYSYTREKTVGRHATIAMLK